jgi:hypothetical protein
MGVKKQVFQYIVFALLINILVIHSVNAQILLNDTVTLSQGDILIINKKKYQIKKDTTFYIPTDVDYKVRTSNYGNAEI